jgi:hypothetical protein
VGSGAPPCRHQCHVEVTKAAGGVSMTSPMGFAEALSDDASLAAASLGESATAYFLISEFQSAVIAAVLVVVIELGAIS